MVRSFGELNRFPPNELMIVVLVPPGMEKLTMPPTPWLAVTRFPFASTAIPFEPESPQLPDG